MMMLVDGTGNSGAAPTVTGAIRNAAQTTGASFEYLLATAQVESGLNPNATAATSSAGGLYQFIDQTWLGTLKDAGPSLGYGQFADAISKSPSGQYEVSDPTMRQEIMALRQNPAANAAMAGAFTQRNAGALAAQLGRAPSEGELYVAHFLGSAGAAKLISAAQSSPQANAATLFPSAAAANHSIFYDKQGQPRSVGEVYGLLVHRYDAARAGPANSAVASNSSPRPPLEVPASSGANPATSNTATTATPVPSSGALDAATFAASQSTNAMPVFHSLFSSEEHRGGVSPVVQELWGTTGGSPAGDVRPPAPPASGSTPSKPSVVSLFSDQPTNVQALFGNGS
jgi:muramidase (phage lysozyme)